MNLRVLRYFLTVAKEQSFTKAAEQLNLTQPTLSRQLAALEEELGAKLFDRGGRSITLTGEGVLLKRQALEIVEMEDKILSEFKGSQEFMEGTITIGCGEFMAVETLAEICRSYREKYPRVQIALHTATADAVSELMGKGIIDIGLFLEPVIKSKFFSFCHPLPVIFRGYPCVHVLRTVSEPYRRLPDLPGIAITTFVVRP